MAPNQEDATLLPSHTQTHQRPSHLRDAHPQRKDSRRREVKGKGEGRRTGVDVAAVRTTSQGNGKGTVRNTKRAETQREGATCDRHKRAYSVYTQRCTRGHRETQEGRGGAGGAASPHSALCVCVCVFVLQPKQAPRWATAPRRGCGVTSTYMCPQLPTPTHHHHHHHVASTGPLAVSSTLDTRCDTTHATSFAAMPYDSRSTA